MALTSISSFDLGEGFQVSEPVEVGASPFWKATGFPLGQQYPGGVVYFNDELVRRTKSESVTAGKSKALAYVNTARVALGANPLDELPKGVPGNSGNCVLARALPGCRGVSNYIVFATIEAAAIVRDVWAMERNVVGNPKSVSTPVVLRDFMMLFDAGMIPELVA